LTARFAYAVISAASVGARLSVARVRLALSSSHIPLIRFFCYPVYARGAVYEKLLRRPLNPAWRINAAGSGFVVLKRKQVCARL